MRRKHRVLYDRASRAVDCWYVHIPRLIAKNFAVGGRDMHLTWKPAAPHRLLLEFTQDASDEEGSGVLARLWIAERGCRGTLRLPSCWIHDEPIAKVAEGILAVHRDEAKQLYLVWEWNDAG